MQDISVIDAKKDGMPRGIPVNRKGGPGHCWIFCRTKRKINIPRAFTIRHRLIY